MPIDWLAITQCASSATNYQVLPGDRIYLYSDDLLAFDAALSKVLAPIERLFGVTLLGSTTIKQLQNMGRNPQGATGTVGGF